MIFTMLLLANPMNEMTSTLEERPELVQEPAEDFSALSPDAYQKKAKEAYEAAASYLARGLGIEASSAFRRVMEKFPFSAYATDAELGVAEAEAVQGNADIAISGFTRFIEQHPTHSKVVEARYGIIKVLQSEWPSSFFMLPPRHERDLEDVGATLIAIRAFIRHHGQDDRLSELKKLQQRAWELMYRRQIYLAQWNEKRGRLKAALRRVEVARQRYPEVETDDQEEIWVQSLRSRADSVKDEVEPPKLHPPRSAYSTEPAK